MPIVPSWLLWLCAGISLVMTLYATYQRERIASLHACNTALFLMIALSSFGVPSPSTSRVTPSGVMGIGATNVPPDATFVLKTSPDPTQTVEVYRKKADGTEVYAPGWNHTRVERWMFLWRCEQPGSRCV